MEDLLPQFDEFVKLEWQTLNFLYNYISPQWGNFGHLSGLIDKYRSKKQQQIFKFHAYWDTHFVDINSACRLFLGVVVRKQTNSDAIENMSYCISVFEGTNEPIKMLRKFHFDYVTVRSDRRQAHPRFHLQYCGGFLPAMSTLGISEEIIEPLWPNVNGPRIFFRPMTFALLMNIAFYEFPGGEIDNIRKRGDWQNIVRENEKQILKPFYERCAQLAGKDKSIFFDKVYV